MKGYRTMASNYFTGQNSAECQKKCESVTVCKGFMYYNDNEYAGCILEFMDVEPLYSGDDSLVYYKVSNRCYKGKYAKIHITLCSWTILLD